MNLAFEFCVKPDHPSLPGHFPGNPVVPAVLILIEVMRGVSERSLSEFVQIRSTKFTTPLRPGELAQVKCELHGARASFRVDTLRGDATVPIAEGCCLLKREAVQ